MLERDRYYDDTDFMQGALDPGRTVRKILEQEAAKKISESELESYIDEFGIENILDRGIRFLSTGEFRKMMIVKALSEKPDLLVLDDPFTGLDLDSRAELESLLPVIRKKIGALVILSGRKHDFECCGQIKMYMLEDGRLSEINALKETSNDGRMAEAGLRMNVRRPNCRGNELIRMDAVGMSYYDEPVLKNINWKVCEGDHWQIIGPNGSGKSSLLSLINGDSPKAYGQSIYLFGKKRGSGESVWDIKKQIGTVSGALQQGHRISSNVLSVVVSGFFDTIGLYDRPDPVQLAKAESWCEEFGLTELMEKPYNSLSEGQKRAVLAVRALIKQPRLMILDEPCQGLDDYNSEFILDVAKKIIESDHSTLLYVSHDPYHLMPGITGKLELVPHPDGGYTAGN